MGAELREQGKIASYFSMNNTMALGIDSVTCDWFYFLSLMSLLCKGDL